MTNVTITQENKLVVNYDTYEISPSNFSDLVIENIWYIDTSSAPDFINKFPVEQNSIKDITIPADTYNLGGYQISRVNNWGTSTSKTFTINDFESTHTEILNSAIKQLALSTTSTGLAGKYFYYIQDSDSWCTNIVNTDVSSDSTYKHILLPATIPARASQSTIGRTSLQNIPLIKSITITFDPNNFKWTTTDWFNIYIIYNGENHSYKLLEGTYTQYDFYTKIFNEIGFSLTFNHEYIYKYPYFSNIRFPNPSKVGFTGDTDFNKLYGLFHLFKDDVLYMHPWITPVNSRCISLSQSISDIYTMINHVNTADSDLLFTLTSNTHDILVTADMPFIINPACSMAVKKKEADTERTFSNQHRICYHPMYQQIYTTVTYNGNIQTISGRYTPAELLQEINNLTSVQASVINTKITFDQPITLGTNNFFSADNTTSPDNICELTAFDNIQANVPITEFYYDKSEYTYLTGFNVELTPTFDGNFITFSSDSLPTGLLLDNSTGTISGTPETEGTFSITITISNYVNSLTFNIVFNIKKCVYLYQSEYDVFADLDQTLGPLYIIDNNNLSFVINEETTYFSIDPSTGLISFNPPTEVNTTVITILIKQNNVTQELTITFNVKENYLFGDIFGLYQTNMRIDTSTYPFTYYNTEDWVDFGWSPSRKQISINQYNNKENIQINLTGTNNDLKYTCIFKINIIYNGIYYNTSWNIYKNIPCTITPNYNGIYLTNYSLSTNKININDDGVLDVYLQTDPSYFYIYGYYTDYLRYSFSRNFNLSIGSFYNSSYIILQDYKQTFNVLTDITNYTLSIPNLPDNISISNDGTITIGEDFTGSSLTVIATNSNQINCIEYTNNIQFTSQESNIYNTSYTVYSNTLNVITPNITLTDFKLLSGPSGMTVISDGTIEWDNPTASAAATITANNNGVTVYIPVTFSLSDSIYSSYTYIPGVEQSFTPILKTYSKYELVEPIPTGVSISNNGTITIDNTYTDSDKPSLSVIVTGNGVKYTVPISLSIGDNPYENNYNIIIGVTQLISASIKNYLEYELVEPPEGVSITSNNGTITIDNTYSYGDINVTVSSTNSIYKIPINIEEVYSPYQSSYEIIKGISQTITPSTTYDSYSLTSAVEGVSIDTEGDTKGVITIDNNYKTGNISVTTTSGDVTYIIPITLNTIDNPYQSSYTIISGLVHSISASITDYSEYKLVKPVPAGVSIDSKNGTISLNAEYTSGNITVEVNDNGIPIPVTINTNGDNQYQASYTVLSNVYQVISPLSNNYTVYSIKEEVTGISIGNNGKITFENSSAGPFNITVVATKDTVKVEIPIEINTEDNTVIYYPEYDFYVDLQQKIKPSTTSYSNYKLSGTGSVTSDGIYSYTPTTTNQLSLSITCDKDNVTATINFTVNVNSGIFYYLDNALLKGYYNEITNSDSANVFNSYSATDLPFNLNIDNKGYIYGTPESTGTKENIEIECTNNNNSKTYVYINITITISEKQAYSPQYLLTTVDSLPQTIKCYVSDLFDSFTLSTTGSNITCNKDTGNLSTTNPNSGKISVIGNKNYVNTTFEIDIQVTDKSIYYSEYTLIKKINQSITPGVLTSFSATDVDSTGMTFSNGQISGYPTNSSTCYITGSSNEYGPVIMTVKIYVQDIIPYLSSYTLFNNKSQTINGGSSLYTSYTANNLPNDLTINNSGIISGSVSDTAKTYNVPITATNDKNVTASMSTSILVSSDIGYLTEYNLVTNLSQTITCNINFESYNIANKPSDMTFNNGVINWTPTSSGDPQITITGTLNGVDTEYEITLHVADEQVYDSEYTFQLNVPKEVTPNTTVFTYFSSKDLNTKTGLEIDTDGKIHGSITKTGTFDVTVTASNNGVTATIPIKIIVSSDNAYASKYTMYSGYQHTITCGVSGLSNFNITDASGVSIDTNVLDVSIDTNNGTITIGSNVSNNVDVIVTANKDSSQLSFGIKLIFIEGELYQSEYNLIAAVKNQIEPKIELSEVTFEIDNINNLSIDSQGTIEYTPQSSETSPDVTVKITSGNLTTYVPITLNTIDNPYQSSYTFQLNVYKEVTPNSTVFTSFSSEDLNTKTGLNIDTDGKIHGSATKPGPFDVTVTASNDSSGVTATIPIKIIVSSDNAYASEYTMYTGYQHTITCGLSGLSNFEITSVSGVSIDTDNGTITIGSNVSNDVDDVTVTASNDGNTISFNIHLNFRSGPVYNTNYNLIANVTNTINPLVTLTSVYESFSIEETPDDYTITNSGNINCTPTTSGEESITVLLNSGNLTTNVPITLKVTTYNFFKSEYTILVHAVSSTIKIDDNLTLTDLTADFPEGMYIDSDNNISIDTPTSGEYTIEGKYGTVEITYKFEIKTDQTIIYYSPYTLNNIGEQYISPANDIFDKYTITSNPSTFTIDDTTGTITIKSPAAGDLTIKCEKNYVTTIISSTISVSTDTIYYSSYTLISELSQKIAPAGDYTSYSATNLPDDLEISNSGVIYGKPTTSGTCQITCTDANGASIIIPVDINISNDVPYLSQYNVINNKDQTISDGTDLFTSYTISNAPEDLTIDNLGTISGTVNDSSGTYNVEIVGSNSQRVTCYMYPDIIVNDVTPYLSEYNLAQYATHIITCNTNLFTSFSITNNPDDMSFSKGVITWEPTSSGDTSITISCVVDDIETTYDITLNVSGPAYDSEYTLIENVEQSIPCKNDIFTEYSSSDLKSVTGLDIHTTNGTISGTPTAGGDVTITATNTGITASIPITFTTNSTTLYSSEYLLQLKSYQIIRPGNDLGTFKVTKGTLPSGMEIDSGTGVISGIPTSSGDYNVTISVEGDSTINYNILIKVSSIEGLEASYTILNNVKQTLKGSKDSSYGEWEINDKPEWINLSSGSLVISNNTSFTEPSYEITITAKYPNGGPIDIIVNLTINDTIPYNNSYTLYKGGSYTISCNLDSSTYSDYEGTLPTGLSINSTSGYITGGLNDSAESGDDYNVKFKNSTQNIDIELTINFDINDKIYEQSYNVVPNNTVTVTPKSNDGFTSFSGTNVSSDGTISFTPSENTTITVTAENNGITAVFSINFIVNTNTAYNSEYNFIVNSVISIPCGVVDVYTNFTATGLTEIGLKIDPVTGEITGSPTGSGTVTITASNDYMSKEEYTVTINVYDENGYQDEYIIQLGSTVKIPSPSDVYTSLSAELPEDLRFENKEIVGTPTKTGETTVTIEAKGDAVSKNYTVTFDIVDKDIYKDNYTVYSNATHVIKPKSSIFTKYQSNNIVNNLKIAENGTISGTVISTGKSDITCSNSYSIYELSVTFNLSDENIYNDIYYIYDGYEQAISNNDDIFDDYSLSDNPVDIGLTIDSSTGVISGKPTITSDIEGNVTVNDNGDTITFPVTFKPKEELIFNSNYLLVLNATNEIIIEGFNDYELNNYPDWVTSSNDVIICTPLDTNSATFDLTLISNNYSIDLPIELYVTEVSGYQSEYDMLIYVDVTIENTITDLFTEYKTENIPPGLDVDPDTGRITGYVSTKNEYNSIIIGTNNNLRTSFNIKFNVKDEIVYVNKYPVIANVLHTIIPQTSVFTSYTLDSTLPAGMTFENGVITINSSGPESTIINVTCGNNISSLTYNLNVNVINEIFYKSYYELILNYENTFDNKLSKQIYTSFSATNLPAGLESDSNYCTIEGVPTEGGQLTIEAAYDNCFANYNIELNPLNKSDIYADNYTLIEGLNNVITPIDNHFTFSLSANIPGMTINSKTGVISGKPLITSFNNETTLDVSLTNYNQSVTIPVTFTITNVPQSTYNVMVGIQQTIQLTGYTTWEAENLPPGLTIDDTGLISGAPESSDHSTYDSIITGTNGNLVTTLPVIFTVYDSVYLPSYDLIYGEFTTIPGSPVYDNWTAENLPPGLTINPSNGNITGKPSKTDTFITTINASNNESNETFTITFNVYFADIYSSSYDMLVGVPQFIPGSTAFTEYSVTGSLPPGLTIDAGNGDITGSPSESGPFNVVITSKNDDYTNEYNVQFIVQDGSIYDSQYVIFIDFEQAISGSEVFTDWTAENLPPGLTINPGNGNITGKPTVEGSWDAVIHGSNSISNKSYPIKFFVINYLYSDFYIFSTNNVIIEPTPTQPGRYISNNLPAELYIDENTGIITGDNIRVNSYFTITYINDDYQINQTIKVKAPAYTYYYM